MEKIILLKITQSVRKNHYKLQTEYFPGKLKIMHHVFLNPVETFQMRIY